MIKIKKHHIQDCRSFVDTTYIHKKCDLKKPDDCHCGHKKDDCHCHHKKPDDCHCGHKKDDCHCHHKKPDDCQCDHKKEPVTVIINNQINNQMIDKKDDCHCHYKKHNDSHCGHKKHNDCCCDHPEVERQVNNPADDTNLGRTQSETSLAHFQDFILYGFNNLEHTGNFSGFAFSNNLGNTWTDGGTIPTNEGGINGGDPVIAVDRNGVFYYGQVGLEDLAGIPQGVISVSTGTVNPNRTITMNPPEAVGRGQFPERNPVDQRLGNQDKEWITVGPDAITPGNEALYITWTDFTTNPTSIRFSKYRTGVDLTPIITDQVIVPSGTNFVSGSFVVVDKRGAIYVFYEEIPTNVLHQPNRTIRMLKSTDGGNTFPITTTISPPFAAAGNARTNCSGNDRPTIRVDNARQIRTNEFPHAAIGDDGTIYVVWNAGRDVGNTTFIDTFLAYSQDEGNSWNQVNVTNNLAFSFFPSVAANCQGAHIQYNRFNDPNGVGGVGNGTFGVFMKTFSPFVGLSEERMVSTQFSPVAITIPNPDAFNCYMGDYNQIIAGPGSCLLHSWGDNRNILDGQPNPDVFFRLTSPKKKRDCDCD
ncbi:exo-alpha-sialidase [Peribacillus frigoritolerans]|uniref:exo-alpha-sialidase n=1 Tax=Peribacillus frigoritolerans TaxID=450367 RepID=UPI003F7E9979